MKNVWKMPIKKQALSLTMVVLVSLICSGCSFLDGLSSQKETVEQDATKIGTTAASSIKTETDKLKADLEKQMTPDVKQAVQDMQHGNYEQALAKADEALQKNANNSSAYSVKGVVLALQGKTDEGLALAKKAYEMNPQDVNNYYNLAIIYKLQGKLDSSREWFEKVLEKDQAHVWSLYGIATIAADLNHEEEAMRYLERAVSLDSSVKDVARTQDHFEKYHGQARFEAIVK